MTAVFEATDVPAARLALSRVYDVREFTAPGEHPYVRVEQDALGPVTLHRVTFGMRCDVGGGPVRELHLGHVTSGSLCYRQGRDSIGYRAGDVFLAARPGDPFQAGIDSADVGYTALGPALLAQAAAEAGGPPRPARFTAYQPATPRDKELWLSTSRFVRNVLASAPAGQPLVTGAAARLLAAAALAVFPNDALPGPAGQDSRDARPATVRRAVTFIDDNAHRDISAADIAAAAFVTPRALQLAFRRHLCTTPTAYLRRVRLEHARRQLATGPGRETVTAVAYRWGFSSPSRFTAYYRQAYGTLPSQALHGQPGTIPAAR